MNWIVFFILAAVMVFTPYQRGLFFDTDFYVLEVVIGIVFLMYTIWIFNKGSQQIRATYLIIFLIPLMYFIVLPIAESPKSNMDILYRWTAYSSFFCMLIWIQSVDWIKKLLPYIFNLCGTAIALLAIVGYWGWFQFHDLIWSGRLAGTFQYPNTFGTIMGAFWLYSLVIITTRQVLKPWMVALFSFPLVAYLTTLLLSESRGTMLILPIAWFVGLVLLGTKNQLKFIANTVISSGVSLVVYRAIISSKEAGVANPGIVPFLVGTVVTVLFLTFIAYLLRGNKLANIENKRASRFALPVLAIVLGILLVADLKFQGVVYHQLPSTLQERVASINTGTSSVLGRTAFYEDGLKMSNDAPILGLGGGGWKVLFTKYQQQPYWSTQTHNGYLEILLDTGWIGLFVFLFVFGILFVQIFKRIRDEKKNIYKTFTIATVPPLIMILMHSLIDFDFSYGTVWLIVVWLFAMGVSEKPLIREKFNFPWLGKVTLAFLVVFVAVFSFKSFKFYLSESKAAQAQGSLTFEKAQSIYEKATNYNPYHVDKLLKLADVYATGFKQTQQKEMQSEILEIIGELEKLEPNNPEVLYGIAKLYTQIGDPITGVKYVDKALEADKYNVTYYDNSIYLKSELAVQMMNKSKSEAMELAKKSINDYENYIRIFDGYKKEPIPDMRALDLKTSTYYYLGQAYLLLGQYQQAVETLDNIKDNVDKELLNKVKVALDVAYEQVGNQKESTKIKLEAATSQNSNFIQDVKTFKEKIGL